MAFCVMKVVIKMLELFLLGTGGTSPLANRALASAAVRADGSTIIIDCGEGLQKELSRNGISPLDIDYIFITHLHMDHISGLMGLLTGIREYAISSNRVKKKITIVGPYKTSQYVNMCMRMITNPYQYPNQIINECLDIRVIEVNKDNKDFYLKDGDFTFRSCKAYHSVPCFAYSIEYGKRPAFDIEKFKGENLPLYSLYSLLLKGQSFEFNGKMYNSSDFSAEDIEILRRGCYNKKDVGNYVIYDNVAIYERTVSKEDWVKLKEKFFIVKKGVTYYRRDFITSLPKELSMGKDVSFNNRMLYADDFVDKVGKEQFKISYVADTRPTTKLREFIKGSNIAVIEGMYRDDSDASKAEKNKHMTWREVNRMVSDNDIKEVILTHYSPSLTIKPEDTKYLKSFMPNGTVGFDGLHRDLAYSVDKNKDIKSDSKQIKTKENEKLEVLKLFLSTRRKGVVDIRELTAFKFTVQFTNGTHQMYVYKSKNSMKEPFKAGYSFKGYYIFDNY